MYQVKQFWAKAHEHLHPCCPRAEARGNSKKCYRIFTRSNPGKYPDIINFNFRKYSIHLLYSTLYIPDPAVKIRISLFDIQYSIFNVRSSIFDTHYPAVNIRPSIFNIRSSKFNIHPSIFDIHYPAINLLPLIFNIRHSIFNIQYSIFNIQYSIFIL